jgi:hypothetical protein
MNDPRAAVNLEPELSELASKHEALITALADLLWPVIRERIVSAIDARIAYAVEHLIDDKITAAVEYGKLITEDDLDQRLNDYTETTDLEGVIIDNIRDWVPSWVDENLGDAVRDVLKHQITLTIDVD